MQLIRIERGSLLASIDLGEKKKCSKNAWEASGRINSQLCELIHSDIQYDLVDFKKKRGFLSFCYCTTYP